MGSAAGNNPTDMSVLLQFAKFSKGYKISDFDKFIQESVGIENLDFFGRLAYPNQWQMRLTNQDVREDLIQTGRRRINNRSCWIYPLNPREIRGFIHWLPNSVTNDQLREYLQLYGEVLFVETQERMVNGHKVECDPRYFGLILSYGTVKEDLPHFLKINSFLCLVLVRGRESACFHCKEVGHRRAECPKYKAKLISFCNREPNTAQERLISRGRRHVKAEFKVKDKILGNEVSSSDDIVYLKRAVPVNEEITEPHLLSISEECKHIDGVQGETKDSTENEFVDRDVLADRKAKSKSDGLDALHPVTKSQTQVILDTIQQIQRKTREDLQRRFKNFEEEIALAVTRVALATRIPDQRRSTPVEDANITLEPEISSNELEKQMETCSLEKSDTPVETPGDFSNTVAVTRGALATDIGDQRQSNPVEDANISLDPEISCKELEKQTMKTCSLEKSVTPVEMPGDFSNVVGTNETKDAEIDSDIPAIYQEGTEGAVESIYVKPEEIEVNVTESTVESSTSNSDTMSALLMLEETKKVAFETIQSIYMKSEEIEKVVQSTKCSAESSKNHSDTMSALLKLKETKKTAMETIRKTFKKMEELAEHTKATERPSIDDASIGDKLTSKEIQSLLIVMKKAEEDATNCYENTFKDLVKITADLSQMAVDEVDPDAKLTVDAISFANQMLEHTKEKLTRTFQNTFRKLEGKVLKAAELSPALSTTGANESIQLTKDVDITTEPLVSLEQPKQDGDTSRHFCEKEKVVETGDDESPEDL